MYCNFFGFVEKPFEITPNPKYLYLNKLNSELFASLVYGVNAKRGFSVIIGEVGTGKTTILNALKGEIDKDVKVAFIFNTNISFKQMLTLILAQLGLAENKKNTTMVESLQYLNEFAIEQSSIGGNVVLIIDEAQNLNKANLENLRLLSNIETSQNKLIQIILSGQPKLDYKLGHPELGQFVQRISNKRYIARLSIKDTYNYIEHRLKIAGCIDQSIFNQESMKSIWEYSEGIPRIINTLCENSLMIGYAVEKKKIDRKVVEEVINKLNY